MESLARDVQVSFDSVKMWLSLFEHLFLTFRIKPWTKKISRAISKETKLYLYDYVAVESEAARYENMVALELWRAVNNWNDSGLGNFTLHYVRNKEKEEVDFLSADENRPCLLIEAKLTDEQVSKSLRKFQNALNVPAVQLVNTGDAYKLILNNNRKILIIVADQWLAGLP